MGAERETERAAEREQPADDIGDELADARTSLAVPATVDSLALVRIVVAGIAAGADMSVDATEDLCLAVDEACLLLLEAFTPDAPGRDGHLRLAFDPVREDTVRVDVQRHEVHPSGPGSDVTTLVLDALTSGWSMRVDGDGPVVHLEVSTRHEER